MKRLSLSCILPVALAGLVGCAKLEKEKEVRVEVTGSSSVEVGATLTLEAQTVNGTDSAYTWESVDPTIATAADGEVFGRIPGETKVRVSGVDTGVETLHPVVVLPAAQSLPNYEDWLGSAHADVTAEAFNHWNEEDPAEVPTDCARCHSSPGYRDYLGADGSDFGVVDAPAPIGSVIDCVACHNDAANDLSTVIFPSGVQVNDLGPEARCMTCHQGRASTDSVDQFLADAGAGDPDTVDEDLHFQNIHYYAAGATLYAGRARGGYQYAGKVYDYRFRHVPGYDTCVGCHDPHSLQVRVNQCATCHDNVSELDDVKDIRMMSSATVDYDGDGNTTEGIYYELQGMRQLLLSAIQLYPGLHGLSDICYHETNYPYWFVDTDANGSCSDEEATFANQYAEWTPRLLKATYNYQVSTKDPGAFAHNAKYIIQLLYDSVEDLGTPVSLTQADRNDPGHFDGASEAARHWDEDEEVSASCSKCHSGSEGFRFYLQYGVGKDVLETANGLDCYTCHENFEPDGFDTVAVDSVTFPSGMTLDNPGDVGNICATCHSGREAKATIDAAIAQAKYGFRNVHYLPAAAVRYGTDALVGYEFSGQTYAAAFAHPGGDSCVDCHDAVVTEHTFHPEDVFADPQGCTVATCHSGAAVLEDIQKASRAGVDYDDDGDGMENLTDELATLIDDTLTAIQVYAAGLGAGTDICYDGNSYPYWFYDTDASGGLCDPGEATYANSYDDWDPTLMAVAHNYQLYQKEPGAWAHNFDYMAQLLIDSVDLLDNGTIDGSTTYIRP